jgi:hypothetical protein
MKESTLSTYRQQHTKLKFYDISTGSISIMCSAITAKSSTSFEASLLVQEVVKPSPAASKFARGRGTLRF